MNIFLHVYMCEYACLRVCVCISVCLYVCVCMCVCVFVYVYIFICMYVCDVWVYKYGSYVIGKPSWTRHVMVSTAVLTCASYCMATLGLSPSTHQTYQIYKAIFVQASYYWYANWNHAHAWSMISECQKSNNNSTHMYNRHQNYDKYWQAGDMKLYM